MRLRFFAALLLLLFCRPALADYPDKPIIFIVPSAPGGLPDVLMRILTAELSKRLGVQFVIINRPGANAVIGTMEIVAASPDGYTLGYGNIVSLAMVHGLMTDVPYRIEDLTLISNCLRVANLLAVNNKVPVHSVRELMDYARRNPDKLTMGSAGNGTIGHLGGELFKAMTGISMLHVPCRGSPPAINDLISGEVQVMFDNLTLLSVYAKSGRVRPLAVSGPHRSPLFPDLPTLSEAGVPGYEMVAWAGVIGPAKLPPEIGAKLNHEIVATLHSLAVIKRFAELDTDIDGSTPEQFLAIAMRERPRWAEIINRAGAKID